MAKSENNPTSSAVAELLPDPTEPRAEVSSSDADDLIASIADQQIDQLINQSEDAPPAAAPVTNVAAEVALTATNELQEMAQTLSNEARADLVADLNGAATEAMLTPIPEVAPADAEAKAPSAPAESATPLTPAEPVVPAAQEIPAVQTTSVAEVAPTAEPPAAPAQTVSSQADAQAAPPNTQADTTVAQADTTPSAQSDSQSVAPAVTPADTAPAAPADAADPLAVPGPAMVLAPADTEINQAEIDALITGAMPTEPSPAVAAPAVDSPQSSADAVARELAADVEILKHTHKPTATEARVSKARGALTRVSMTALEWINLPVRGLSDGSREILGIIAIVTLVNAMSLLLYLMIFR